jgi:hypothetical protein
MGLDRMELGPRRGRACREGRDAGVILLSWALVAAVMAPLALGGLSLAAPGTFAEWFGAPGAPRAPFAPRLP